MRATDQALEGHELTDRPEQILLLAGCIAKLAEHIFLLTGRSALCTSANRAAVRDQLDALQVAVNALDSFQVFADSPQSLSDFQKQEVTAAAVAGLEGEARLEKVLCFIVEFQRSYSLRRVVDVEPDFVVQQMTRVLPIMRQAACRSCRERCRHTGIPDRTRADRCGWSWSTASSL